MDLPLRNVMYKRLIQELEKQIFEAGVHGQVEILTDMTMKTIGEKSNSLMERAKGEYLNRFDDDDKPGPNYIKCNFEGIRKGVDVNSLRGIITWDSENPEVFEHSLKYDKYETLSGIQYPDVKYLRFPNHLNCMRSSIAKQFQYPFISHGEDTEFATQVHKSGLLKTEHYIDEVIYNYRFIANK